MIVIVRCISKCCTVEQELVQFILAVDHNSTIYRQELPRWESQEILDCVNKLNANVSSLNETYQKLIEEVGLLVIMIIDL